SIFAGAPPLRPGREYPPIERAATLGRTPPPSRFSKQLEQLWQIANARALDLAMMLLAEREEAFSDQHAVELDVWLSVRRCLSPADFTNSTGHAHRSHAWQEWAKLLAVLRLQLARAALDPGDHRS